MKAILVREFGTPEVLVLGDAPEPSPGPGQVLIRVHACGVNPADTYIRAGGHRRSPKVLPYIPGTDVAGVVEGVGAGVSGTQGGERVYTLGVATGHGGYAGRSCCCRSGLDARACHANGER